MSQHRPSIDNLLATARQFLDDLAPQLAAEARYKVQVASFLLAICERELNVGNAHSEADRAAWTGLLGNSEVDTSQLARELCAKIRSGTFDETFDEVLETVLARTTDDVRVVRPDHLEANG